MKEVIGKTAGRIWEVLREKEKVNVTQLPKTLKEKTLIVYQALGWLARENKIDYHKKGDKIFVSLSGNEKK
ncbi:MAG TPA: winged helix-turn-helix domain-containing protein [Nitrospinota bacterium]|nr:winged helix-turn-helix domain-containing protein [Nitrospinota bacterium]